MHKYVVLGKTSKEFSSSMVSKPQNRKDIVAPFVESLGGNLLEMLYLNHPNEEAVAPMTGIIKASGMFDDLNWYRAFDSGELKQIYEVASTKMTEYVSARSFVEND